MRGGQLPLRPSLGWSSGSAGPQQPGNRRRPEHSSRPILQPPQAQTSASALEIRPITDIRPLSALLTRIPPPPPHPTRSFTPTREPDLARRRKPWGKIITPAFTNSNITHTLTHLPLPPKYPTVPSAKLGKPGTPTSLLAPSGVRGYFLQGWAATPCGSLPRRRRDGGVGRQLGRSRNRVLRGSPSAPDLWGSLAKARP